MLALGAQPPLPAARVDPTRIRGLRELNYPRPLLGCRFDPLGHYIFAGAEDRTIQRWDLNTGQRVAYLGHRSWVRGLTVSHDGKTLIAGDYAGQVLVWPSDASLPRPLRALHAHVGWVRAVALSPDDKYLATCGNDNLVKVWSMADGKLLRQLAGHSCHVYDVAFDPSVPTLTSGDLNGAVKQWDLATGRLLRDLDTGLGPRYDKNVPNPGGGIRALTYRSDGKFLVCAGITDVQNAFAGVGRPLVLLFDLETGRRQPALVPKENFQGTAWGAVFHPDGFVIGVGGGRGGALWFWRPDQPQAFFTLKVSATARDLALHPDGQRLAVAFGDGTLRLYEMPWKTTNKVGS
jgi:WD40 repeat protein